VGSDGDGQFTRATKKSARPDRRGNKAAASLSRRLRGVSPPYPHHTQFAIWIPLTDARAKRPANEAARAVEQWACVDAGLSWNLPRDRTFPRVPKDAQQVSARQKDRTAVVTAR
jgi:hypothetical protein